VSAEAETDKIAREDEALRRTGIIQCERQVFEPRQRALMPAQKNEHPAEHRAGDLPTA
jgi:hypothetical protein